MHATGWQVFVLLSYLSQLRKKREHSLPHLPIGNTCHHVNHDADMRLSSTLDDFNMAICAIMVRHVYQRDNVVKEHFVSADSDQCSINDPVRSLQDVRPEVFRWSRVYEVSPYFGTVGLPSVMEV